MNPNRLTILSAVVLTAFTLGSFGCGGSKLKPVLSAHSALAIGKSQYDKKKYVKAIDSFQQVVYNYPGDPVVDTAQYYLGLAYVGNEDYALAAVEFNRLVLNYPGSVYADHAQFMHAVSLFEDLPKNEGLDQTNLPMTIQLLEDFIVEHPESPVIPDANKYLSVARDREAKRLYSSAVVYARINASEAAKIYYQKVIDDYTGSEYAPLASFGIAEEEMRIRNFDEARRRFDNFVIVYPSHTLFAKSRKRSADAAFKAGETALKKADYQTAQFRFQTFKSDFPNDSRVKKAEQYLAELVAKAGSVAPDGKPGS